MAGRVGYFWSARHSQIYPELAKLEDGGYVTHSVVEQRERPDKKVYEITAEGLDALQEWVTRPPVPRPTRDELTLKTYSVWLADEENAVRLFREEELRHEEQLAHYEKLKDWMEGEWRRISPLPVAPSSPPTPRSGAASATRENTPSGAGGWPILSKTRGSRSRQGAQKRMIPPCTSGRIRAHSREPEDHGATQVP